jgi:phosphatidylinositol-3-phosphatase
MRKLAVLAALLVAQVCLAQVPQAGHVFVVVEENHSYSSVIGNTSMPYLNSLAQNYGLATQYYANTHPSIGNYFMMTTGQIITNNDGYTSTVTADNIVRHFLTNAITWKSYAESLPYVGYTGGDVYPYIEHHNPMTYFSDVRNSSVQRNNLVPFTQFATDLANNALPRFSFIVPNQLDNAHDGTLGAADTWLKNHIAPLIASPVFQKDGLLIIVFDESYSSDTAYGGGHVAFVAVGPMVKKAYKSTTHYQHQNLLKTVMEALGETSFPGAASSAVAMADLFGSSTPPPSGCTMSTVNPSVTVCTPTPNSTAGSPVHVVAGTTDTTPIALMQIYLDGVKVYQIYASKLDTYVTMGSGTHRLTVLAKDTSGVIFKSTEYITVP